MKGEARKAATAAYKERKAVAGIYQVRCLSTNQRWVGRAPDLAAIKNRLWFTMRLGSSPYRSLQAAWQAHGEESFTLEELERLEDEEQAYVRDRLLKERLDHWCAKLAAEAI